MAPENCACLYSKKVASREKISIVENRLKTFGFFYLDMSHSPGEKPKKNDKGRQTPSFGVNIESSFVMTEMNSKHSQVYLDARYQA